MTSHPRFNWRAYTVQMLIGLAGYTAALFGSISTLQRHHDLGGFALPIALLPMIPGLWITFVVLKFYARLDELQRRIQSEAFIASAIITGLGASTLSFASNAGFQEPNLSWFFPTMIGLWGLLGCLLRYRYR